MEMRTSRPEVVVDAAAQVTRRVMVGASTQVVFALVADPREHPGLDAVGMVKSMVDRPDRVTLGSVFRMQMKGYQTTNTVVEYEPDALIAWRHRGRHIWRWQLRPVPGGTEVTETFDYTAKRGRRLVELIGVPRRAGVALDKTLTGLRARFA